MKALLPAAWLGVRHGRLAAPLVAAVALLLCVLPWPGQAVTVLHGVAVLVACALAAALDEPSGDLVTAAASRRSAWTCTQLLAASAVVLPVLGLAFLLARWRLPVLPTAGFAAESAGYLLVAVAVAAGLRAWRGTHVPSYPAVIGVLVAVLLSYSLPRGWVMVNPQPWGPPYAAALWRWLGLALVAVAVLVAAVRDPLER